MKKKNDKKKKGLIIAIFAVAILMAVGYAALQATLTINAVGKIYSDWDVEFTDSECEIVSPYNLALDEAGDTTTSQMQCLAQASDLKDHLELYEGGIVDDGDENKGDSSGLGGIELALYTEFATPEDVTTFDIEITNFSAMWDAALMSITHTNVSADDTKTDWILYEFDGLFADGGTINPADGTTKLTTVLDAATGSTYSTVGFTITATWNPDYDDVVPATAIKKSTEKAGYATTSTETYIQEDTFVLLWEAFQPGEYEFITTP